MSGELIERLRRWAAGQVSDESLLVLFGEAADTLSAQQDALREIRSIADQAVVYAVGPRPQLDPGERFAMIAECARAILSPPADEKEKG